MTPHPQQEYIIDDWMLQVWRTGCVNLSNPYTDDDKCRMCEYRGKDKRERCCDFDDNAMQKIFQSRPYSSQQSGWDKVLDVCDCCEEDSEGCNGDYQICQREHEKLEIESRINKQMGE